MISVNVAEFARQNPDIALQVFHDTERAVQELLPGSDYHPRYGGIDAVGLATVIAPYETPADALNPTRPGVLDHTIFVADNSVAHPDAWPELKVGGGLLVLGAEPQPENAERFVAFALAKANRLTLFPKATSSHHEIVTPAPGVVSLAGARRIGGEIMSNSGLLEVHDDIVTLAQAGELIRYANSAGYETNDDEITSRLKAAFDNLSQSYPEVADITLQERKGVGKMVIANRIFFDLDRDFTTAN